jgi:ribokinase
MLGRVGKDNFGDFLLDNLKNNNVNAQNVFRDDASTGTAIILVDANGQNSIVLSAGANGKVSSADVSPASLSWVSLLLLQLEIPIGTVLSAARLAKENNVRVILNPAPAQALPDELIAFADFIIPNETELNLLTSQNVENLSAAETAARMLLKRGAKNVIVTLGANGALLVNQAMVKHIPAYKINPVDTTAAGDAFIGGFAVALTENKSLEESIRYGCACGALAATKFGAQPSLPARGDVDEFINT